MRMSLGGSEDLRWCWCFFSDVAKLFSAGSKAAKTRCSVFFFAGRMNAKIRFDVLLEVR